MTHSNYLRRRWQAKQKIDLWQLQETVKNQGRMIAHLNRNNETLKGLVDLLREDVADLVRSADSSRKPWWIRWFSR